MIGDTMGDFARSVGRFESELSALSGALGGLESDLAALGADMEKALDSADKTLQDDMNRWLENPPDATWPPDAAEGESAAVERSPVEKNQAPMSAVVAAAPSSQPFKLEWHTSPNKVKAGDSFTLTVRMYDVQQSGEHGGISVSFPSLNEPGGSNESHSSSAADVDALDYTTGLSKVAFHQPGATIYHKDNNRQFPAGYLLVESDDPSWSRSDDRTLSLRITPKRGGDFPIQIRGWLCADGYTCCERNPSAGSVTDQQGHAVQADICRRHRIVCNRIRGRTHLVQLRPWRRLRHIRDEYGRLRRDPAHRQLGVRDNHSQVVSGRTAHRVQLRPCRRLGYIRDERGRLRRNPSHR